MSVLTCCCPAWNLASMFRNSTAWLTIALSSGFAGAPSALRPALDKGCYSCSPASPVLMHLGFLCGTLCKRLCVFGKRFITKLHPLSMSSYFLTAKLRYYLQLFQQSDGYHFLIPDDIYAFLSRQNDKSSNKEIGHSLYDPTVYFCFLRNCVFFLVLDTSQGMDSKHLAIALLRKSSPS